MNQNEPSTAESTTAANSTDAAPFISVVIATRGRRDRLKRCLDSLARQSCPRSTWELIVVRDGDQDPLDLELAALSERLPLRWFRVDHAGCGIAKNVGAWKARGRYLVFTDDDCLFPPDWLSCYMQEFERNPDALVVGSAFNPQPANPWSDASQELVNYALSRWNSSRQATFAIGNNFGVPAASFRELGGFNPIYYPMAGEDRDFAAHWTGLGRPSRYAPEIFVEHGQALTFRSLLRQQYFYGRGAFLFHRVEAARRKTDVSFSSPAFYLSLLAWPWKVRQGRGALHMTLLFVCAQAAHTWGYLRAALTPVQPGANRMEAALASLEKVNATPREAMSTVLAEEDA